MERNGKNRCPFSVLILQDVCECYRPADRFITLSANNIPVAILTVVETIFYPNEICNEFPRDTCLRGLDIARVPHPNGTRFDISIDILVKIQNGYCNHTYLMLKDGRCVECFESVAKECMSHSASILIARYPDIH